MSRTNKKQMALQSMDAMFRSDDTKGLFNDSDHGLDDGIVQINDLSKFGANDISAINRKSVLSDDCIGGFTTFLGSPNGDSSRRRKDNPYKIKRKLTAQEYQLILKSAENCTINN